jgi:glutamyl-tRNA reductase
MNLLVVGTSYRTAEVSMLERLSITGPELPAALAALLRREHVSEAVVVSTCNRVEVYAGVSAFHGGVADVSAALAERAGLDPARLAPHLYVHWAADAVTHALRVAAGLDSMVAGESQILGQVREAYTAATGAGAAGRLLHDLLQQALRVGKRVHAETGIDAAGRSVVTAALELAATTWQDRPATPAAAAATAPGWPALVGRSALVVGAGSMGALALATLARAGAGPLYVASRTAARAARLAAAYGARPVSLAELAEPMAAADLVVSATTSARPVLTAELVGAALRRRPAALAPLVLCDLAVPRDVAVEVAELSGVALVDLARLAAAAPRVATADIAAAEEIVSAEAATIAGQLGDAEVAPTVAALRARADELVAVELARLTQRLPELSEAQRAEVAHAVHRLVQRLLHQPTVRVRQLAAEPGGQAYAAVLAELFDLQVPQPRRADEVPDLAPRPRPSGTGGRKGGAR